MTMPVRFNLTEGEIHQLKQKTKWKRLRKIQRREKKMTRQIGKFGGLRFAVWNFCPNPGCDKTVCTSLHIYFLCPFLKNQQEHAKEDGHIKDFVDPYATTDTEEQS